MLCILLKYDLEPGNQIMFNNVAVTEKLKYRESDEVSQSDESLIVERAKNDPQAFGILYDRTYSRILNYIYRRTLNITTAEELTSNTYLKAIKALPRYNHRAPFIAWLYSIATNEIRMHARQVKRDDGFKKDPRWICEIDRIQFESPDNRIEDEIKTQTKMMEFERVSNLVKTLPDIYQSVIVLRYFEEMSYSEIGDVLGKKVGTVKSLVNRGLKRLRRMMDGQDFIPNKRNNLNNFYNSREDGNHEAQ